MKLASVAISNPAAQAATPNTGAAAPAASTCAKPGNQAWSSVACGRTRRSVKDRIGSAPQLGGEIFVEIEAGPRAGHHTGADHEIAEPFIDLAVAGISLEQR